MIPGVGNGQPQAYGYNGIRTVISSSAGTLFMGPSYGVSSSGGGTVATFTSPGNTGGGFDLVWSAHSGLPRATRKKVITDVRIVGLTDFFLDKARVKIQGRGFAEGDTVFIAGGGREQQDFVDVRDFTTGRRCQF